MNKDLCPPNLSPKKHRHESGLRGEFEVSLLHPMLDNAAVNIIKQGFDDCRVAVWAVIVGEVAKVTIESIEKGVLITFIENEARRVSIKATLTEQSGLTFDRTLQGPP